MKNEIEFDDFAKLNLVVGEMKNGNIDIDGKKFELDIDLEISDGDKIVVGLLGDGIVIPFARDSFLSVDSDIDSGSVVG